MFKQGFVVFLLFLMLCLVSCGEKTAGSAPAAEPGKTAIDPMDLISKTQAEGILGVALSDGVSKEDASGTLRCFYEGENAYFQVALVQQSLLPEGITTQDMYTSIKENMDEQGIMPIENLGEEAYLLHNTGVHILEGDYYISIDINLITPDLEDPEAMQDQLKSAGELAVKNLEEALT